MGMGMGMAQFWRNLRRAFFATLVSLLSFPALAAQYQVSTADEPTMFAVAQGLGFIPAATAYAPGIVTTLTGGVDAQGNAWAANFYGAQSVPTGSYTTNAQGQQVPVMQTNPGFYGILLLPDGYTLPGDTQTLSSRVFVPNNSTVPPSATITPYLYGPVTITGVPANSPVVFS